MSEITKYIVLLLAAACVVAMTGCGSSNDKKTVVVSIEPQRWLLSQITGDKLNIKTLLPANTEAENFDPTFSSIKNAAKASVFMKTGTLAWEDVLVEKIKSGNENLKIIDTSQGIEPIEGTHGHHEGCNHDHGDGEEMDPHIWTSVRNAKIMARNMYDAIIAIDDGNKDYYSENYARLIEKLDSMDVKFQNELAESRNKSFVVFHPSLSYFARDYGLEQVPIGQEGKEMSINSLIHKIKEIREHATEVIFCQSENESKQIETLLPENRLKKIIINPMSYDWDEEMGKIVEGLK